MLVHFRLRILGYIFAAFFLSVGIRVFYLQVLHRDFFQNLSEQQSTRVVKLKAQRGKILDSHKRLFAEDTYSYSVWANPHEIKNKESTAQAVSESIRMDAASVLQKISSEKKFVWIKRKLDYDVYQVLKQKKLAGIYVMKEQIRFYPEGAIAAQVLGFVDVDHKGIEGVELLFNHYLHGRDGWAYTLRDCRGQLLPLKNLLVPARDGNDVVLNIDAQIQYWVEAYLDEAIQKYRAKGGSVVVMEPSTGKVLALVSNPSFDPNNVGGSPKEAFRNRAITDTYEPGSVFKAITLVASLQEKTFSDTDVIYCENGEYKIPGTILHDWKPYGRLAFPEVFEKSSNIGVAKIASALKPQVLYNYIKRFRIGEPTGIDLAGEVRSIVKKPEHWSKTSPYIIPIGQEVTTTNIQLASAYCIIANGGYAVRPQVVQKVLSSSGITIKDFPLHRSRDPIVPQEIMDHAKKILTRVVAQGTAKLAKIDGVNIAGKTGTAQKVEPGTKHYSKSKYIVSFVGFFPVEKPAYVVSVVIDEPAYAQYGGVICAPVFKRIAEFLLKYRNTSAVWEGNP